VPDDDQQLSHAEVAFLREHDAAWRLLRAGNAPLVIGFLGRVFVRDNVRAISATELTSRLDDELWALNAELGECTYPRPAKAYVDEWASPEAGWLRKFYPPDGDEPHVDATPALEKAVAWVETLQARAFIGTESRLNTIVELLRQMVFGAETDPEARLAELHRRRAEIDRQIADMRQGHLPMLDDTAVRDRYQQFARTARELLADFREVETNFRALDRQLREQIASWSGSKGELLDTVLGSRASIAESDQGRSFQAFYDFLLDELTELLDRVHALPAVDDGDPRLRQIHYDWLDAGERTQATVRLLSEQLRRFLDDQVWLENRRVMDLLRSIEATAIRLRGVRAVPVTTELADPAPGVALPMERPLYSPGAGRSLDSSVEARPDGDEVDPSVLFEQVHVDREGLTRGVRRALRARDQVGLAELIEQRPIEHGLAELVTYLSLDDDVFEVVLDPTSEVRTTWLDGSDTARTATLPRVTFARRRPTMEGFPA
jgi:flagellar motility protein MotE (MotC chaperone)